MTIPQQAIDAGRKALEAEALRVGKLPEKQRYETDRIHPEGQIGTDPLWISGRVDLIAQQVLKAARPHIEADLRQKIAAEIKADIHRVETTTPHSTSRTIAIQARKATLKIVEGKP